MIRSALWDHPIEIHGDGSQSRCFTYVDDVVTAIVSAGRNPGRGRLLHIGSTDEVTIAGLASRIAGLTGSEAGVVFTSPEARWGGRYQDIARRVPDRSTRRSRPGMVPFDLAGRRAPSDDRLGTPRGR